MKCIVIPGFATLKCSKPENKFFKKHYKGAVIMIKTISKTKRTLALIAIFFSTLAVMADLAITPVIGMIYGYYPDNMSAVNYIVSGPMLVLVVASLITPLLTRKLNKKVSSSYPLSSSVLALLGAY